MRPKNSVWWNTREGETGKSHWIRESRGTRNFHGMVEAENRMLAGKMECKCAWQRRKRRRRVQFQGKSESMKDLLCFMKVCERRARKLVCKDLTINF